MPLDKMSDQPPARRRVVAAPARRQPTELQSIRVVVEHDPDPDASFLEQDEFEDRLASFKRGEFEFVGVRAEAEVLIESTLQTITSPGLWGIESDSGEEYIAGIAVEEYEQLSKVLKTIGVPTAQLAADEKRLDRVEGLKSGEDHSHRWRHLRHTEPVAAPDGMDDDPKVRVYAYARFRSLEHVCYGLSRTDGGPEDDEIDSQKVGEYGMEPIATYWDINDALKEIESDRTHGFEDEPYVEVDSEDSYNEALEALGYDPEDTSWPSDYKEPGLYDFRDDPPSYVSSVEDYELVR